MEQSDKKQPTKTKESLAQIIGYFAGFAVAGMSFLGVWLSGSRGSPKVLLEFGVGALLGLAAYFIVWGIGAAVSWLIRDLRKGRLSDTTPVSPPQEDRMVQLERIGNLWDQGILTDEEFEVEKRRVLDSQR